MFVCILELELTSQVQERSTIPDQRGELLSGRSFASWWPGREGLAVEGPSCKLMVGFPVFR